MAPKSYYKTIAGVKYDRELLEMAEKAAADGQVSVKEAEGLWKAAQDGRGVTKIERRTLEYVLKEVKFTDKAAEYLKGELKGKGELQGKSNGGYYKIVDGVKYDRELLEQAEQAAKDGQISVGEARALWESALDGHGVTNNEKLTLEHVLKAFKCTKPAKEFLEKELLTVKVKPDEIDESMPDAAVTAKVEPAQPEAVDEDLPDFDEDEPAAHAEENQKDADTKKGGYAAIHASGFRDFLLKPELLRAIVDCGFEHPSEVQHECIPQAILGTDILCQAKSGMGKTAVFVLATLHQLVPSEHVSVIVLCHARELAFQIGHEYNRFSKYLPDVKTAVLYGGVPRKQHIKLLQEDAPHVVIGTPGRVLDLVSSGHLKLDNCKHFVLDECDKMLEAIDMRADVQKIFMKTPRDKQVMMFSATLSEAVRPVCRKYMQDPMEVYVDKQSKLTLHGLLQYYIKLESSEKNKKLTDLLDVLEFNQVVIFVSKVMRAKELDRLLQECNFPSICVTSQMKQADRIQRYKEFKEFHRRILVTTDLMGRGIDVERVNIVINYDFPGDQQSYLHRVGRAGRFGTKGLAVSFISSEEDAKVLAEVQARFEVDIPELPDSIDTSSYMS